MIKVEKTAEEYFQESDNSKTKSDEDSKKRDIGTSLEKTSIKSNLSRPTSLPSSPTPPGRSSTDTQSA